MPPVLTDASACQDRHHLIRMTYPPVLMRSVCQCSPQYRFVVEGVAKAVLQELKVAKWKGVLQVVNGVGCQWDRGLFYVVKGSRCHTCLLAWYLRACLSVLRRTVTERTTLLCLYTRPGGPRRMHKSRGIVNADRQAGVCIS